MNQRVGRWALLLGTMLFATLGQLYFAKRPNFFWDGVTFYVVAGLCLLALARASQREQPASLPVRQRVSRGDRARYTLILLGLVLGAIAVLRLMRPHENYWPIFAVWVAGMVACMAAGLPAPQVIAKRARVLVAAVSPWEAFFVVVLTLAAFALRAWHVDTIPWTLSGDEGNFGRWAREALDGRLTNMFSTGHLSMPSLYAFFQAAWLKLFGDDTFALRLPWAVLGTLSVVGTYLLVRRLFNPFMAALVAFLVAGYHFHIHYSRLGLNNISDPLFVVWSLFFFVVAIEGGRRWAWAATGLVAGMAFYFYTGGRQVPVVLLAVGLWALLLDNKTVLKDRRGLILGAVTFLVTVGPIALFAFQHPDDFNARINQVGVFQSGWLEREAEMLGRSKLLVLLEQFRRVFFAFNHFLDRTDFYRPAIPLLDFPSSMLFLLGVVLSLARLAPRTAEDEEGENRFPAPVTVRMRYAIFVIWFLVVIITGGVLTEGAPSSQRIVSSSIPAIFFVSVALVELVSAFGRLTRAPLVVRRAVITAVAIVLFAGSVRFYFGRYQESWAYGSFNGEVSTAIGHYMRDLGPEWKQYFMGAPRMWAEFGSATFISKNPYLDVIEPLNGPPTFVDPGYNAAFIVLPERENELASLQEAYPGGVTEKVHRVGEPDGPLLFTGYKVAIKSN